MYDTPIDKIFDFIEDHPLVSVSILIISIILLSFGTLCFHLNIGEKQYTGYIYSAEDDIDKTVGHLRFSETAGMDEQPSFCMDKRDGKQIKDLAGSGKKVKVIVPAGVALSLPWACPIPASIELMEEK